MFFRDLLIFVLFISVCLPAIASSNDNRLVLDDMVIVAKRLDENISREQNGSISLREYSVLKIAKAFKENQGIEINFDIGFANNSTVLTADGRQVVDVLALVMDFVGEEYQFEIRGHTDESRHNDSKKKLSENRARVVANQLQVKHDIANHLTARGLADTRPMTSNTIAKGEPINNRISIVSKTRGQQLVSVTD